MEDKRRPLRTSDTIGVEILRTLGIPVDDFTIVSAKLTMLPGLDLIIELSCMVSRKENMPYTKKFESLETKEYRLMQTKGS